MNVIVGKQQSPGGHDAAGWERTSPERVKYRNCPTEVGLMAMKQIRQAVKIPGKQKPQSPAPVTTCRQTATQGAAPKPKEFPSVND
jgi:hypothetical protein